MYSNQTQANTNGGVVEMEAELEQLRREVEVLQAKRDILKKAMSIVS
ncbi:MAG: hypothetical protein LCI00_06465 [Chloroflexi bacterium]|nr:hypothetical protein [Chloroflexota bacterium]MCC6891766.1 hypothetical protein [Anaerolineae bacterium]